MVIQSTTAPTARARNRTRPGNTPPPQQNPGATADWMTAGAGAIEQARQHQERMAKLREERGNSISVPYRHYLGKGEEVDAIILDNDFGPGIYEHDLTFNDRFKRVDPRTGRARDQYVVSPCMFETDPLTSECGLNPYYAVYITVALLRPYTDSKGRHHTYQRRLVPLKGDAIEMMAGIREQQIKAGFGDKPLRGVHVVFRRSNSDQSLRTGLPIFSQRHDEQAILETFGHPEVISEEDGKLIKRKDEDCYPVDYSLAFPKPSAEGIRARFNLPGAQTPGSNGYGAGQFNDGARGGYGGGGYSGGAQEQGGGASTEGFNEQPEGGSGGMAGNYDDLDDDIPF